MMRPAHAFNKAIAFWLHADPLGRFVVQEALAGERLKWSR